jgi:predicted GNAT family acetyltransferase
METSVENLEVIHNEAENRFETWVDGQLSKLDYSIHGSTIMMLHVGVHPEQRGQGIAGKITQAGLEYAKEKNLRVIPMCSYVAAYIRRHPEYAELMKPQPGA